MPAPRFRLEPEIQAEQVVHEEVAKFLAACLLPPVMWNCFPLGHVSLSPAQLARLQRAGLQAGWPDFLVIFGGLIFGLEIKRVGGKLSKTRQYRTKRGQLRIVLGQEEVFPKLDRAGMKIAVVHSVEETMAALGRFGIPYRGRSVPSGTPARGAAVETGLAGAGPDHPRRPAQVAKAAGKPAGARHGDFIGRARG